MDPSKFTSSKSGTPVLTQAGYWAFIPAPLPAVLNWSTELVKSLTNAERELANLSGLAKGFPFPEVIYQPIIHTEAVISSRIEGTHSDIIDLYSFEAQQLASFESTDDVKEIYNYVRALEYGLSRLKTFPMSLRLIREIHQRLMHKVRGEHLTPGEFRRSQNWIGPAGCSMENAPYVPPPVDEMYRALNAMEMYIHRQDEVPLLVKLGEIHYQFEAIHPFLDGNGRIGRLLVILLMCDLDLLPSPVLNISTFFHKYQQEYYKNLLDVSQKGSWESWLEFFFEGVKLQSKMSAQKIHHIYEMRDRYQILTRKLRNTPRMHKIIDFLFIHPVFTLTQMASDLDIPFKSIGKYVDVMVSANIIHEITGQARNRVYQAGEILSILQEN